MRGASSAGTGADERCEDERDLRGGGTASLPSCPSPSTSTSATSASSGTSSDGVSTTVVATTVLSGSSSEATGCLERALRVGTGGGGATTGSGSSTTARAF